MKKSELRQIIRGIINEQEYGGVARPHEIPRSIDCCEKIKATFSKSKTILLSNGVSDNIASQINNLLENVYSTCCDTTPTGKPPVRPTDAAGMHVSPIGDAPSFPTIPNISNTIPLQENKSNKKNVYKRTNRNSR